MTGVVKRTVSEKGFTYIHLLLIVVIMGISLSAVGRYWSYLDKKDKEAELLFRGDQFVRAIDSYYKRAHGKVNIYPKKMEDLLKDPRSLAPRRHLRRIYKDPMTGEDDWIPIIDPASKRIKGVKSRSEDTPLKTDGFPLVYQSFKDKGSYSEWGFVHVPGMKW